jgi:hypothetical protein
VLEWMQGRISRRGVKVVKILHINAGSINGAEGYCCECGCGVCSFEGEETMRTYEQLHLKANKLRIEAGKLKAQAENLLVDTAQIENGKITIIKKGEYLFEPFYRLLGIEM